MSVSDKLSASVPLCLWDVPNRSGRHELQPIGGSAHVSLFRTFWFELIGLPFLLFFLGAMHPLPLLLLGSLLAASAAPAPAPWPVPLHDAANTNCNPSAVLQTRYCPYGLGLDVRFETAVSFPAPDAAYVNQLLADERQQLEIFANLAYKNLTKSRNAVNVTLSLPEFNPYSYVWFGTAASGTA